ncbi:MAG TPA: hypothetical protein VFB06_36945 [Streptosporangiaceae bacterium]|nr:hypothetical protein [Streptosporangiaceae bacterium]
MAVTDQQLAALRARLAGDMSEHERLLGLIDWMTGATAYALLVDAAFTQAVTRKFGPGSTDDEVAAYVSDAGAPQAAEMLISNVLGRGSIDELDPKTAFGARQFVLSAIVAEEQLSAAELDSFLDDARKLADTWLARM